VGQQDAATVVRRYSDVSFPSRVEVGKATHLRVRIARMQYHTHDAALELVFGPSMGFVPVTVDVAAENFILHSAPQAILRVPRKGDSAGVQFSLAGERIGPGRIMIDFSLEGRPIGSVDLSVEVASGPGDPGSGPSPRGEVQLHTGQHGPPDVTVYVYECWSCPGRLLFFLCSRHPRLQDLPFVNHGELGSIDLRQNTVDWVERQLDIVHRCGSAGGDRHLADLGNRLYDQLLPEKLQHLCWSLAERGVKTLLVVSDEPYIPWELIRPYRRNPATGRREELPFWGESFALSRWLRGPGMPEHFSLQRICAVVPEGPAASQPGGTSRDIEVVPLSPVSSGPALHAPALPGARKELQALLALKETGADVKVLPARRSEVLATLEKGAFDLLHVASHGTFHDTQAADTAALLLEDVAFQAAELSPRLADGLRQSAPLVFFNACQTGRIGYSLTRLGAWSAELIRLGCGGFIGTHWRVTDDVALEVAREFYRLLFLGTPIAEALRCARQKVRAGHPDDPTWLAYSCYADPTARIAARTTTAVPVPARGPVPTPGPRPVPDPAPAAEVPAAAALPTGAQPRLLVLRGQKRNVEYPIYEGLNFIGRADEKPVDDCVPVLDRDRREPLQ
jgi:hypothetical protein